MALYGENGGPLLAEALGIPFIEKARSLGINVICAHKGFPLPFLRARAHELPTDVGRVAKRFPDAAGANAPSM